MSFKVRRSPKQGPSQTEIKPQEKHIAEAHIRNILKSTFDTSPPLTNTQVTPNGQQIKKHTKKWLLKSLSEQKESLAA